MNLTLLYQPSVAVSASPLVQELKAHHRLLDEQGQEVAWANAFLDAQRVRQLSLRSLRAYAYDLLHFARWLQQPLPEITEATLLDYVRHQLDREPPPTPQSVNHRLGVVHCLYRFHYGREIPGWSIPFRTHVYEAAFAYANRGASLCRSPPMRPPSSGTAFELSAIWHWWA